MHVRCLHETDFTLAPGIAPEHPFFPQLEQCLKSNPLDRTAFVSMKGASGHPCTCRLAQLGLMTMTARAVSSSFLAFSRVNPALFVLHQMLRGHTTRPQ